MSTTQKDKFAEDFYELCDELQLPPQHVERLLAVKTLERYVDFIGDASYLAYTPAEKVRADVLNHYKDHAAACAVLNYTHANKVIGNYFDLAYNYLMKKRQIPEFLEWERNQQERYKDI